MGNTGCETNVTNDTKNCGTCGRDCTMRVKNATGITCGNGSCNYAACAMGFFDCDGNRSNGCESATTCPACGIIGLVCCAGNVCTQGQCEPAPANDGKCH